MGITSKKVQEIAFDFVFNDFRWNKTGDRRIGVPLHAARCRVNENDIRQRDSSVELLGRRRVDI